MFDAEVWGRINRMPSGPYVMGPDGVAAPTAAPAPGANPLDIFSGQAAGGATGQAGLDAALGLAPPPPGPTLTPPGIFPNPYGTVGPGDFYSQYFQDDKTVGTAGLPQAPSLPLEYTSTAGMDSQVANAQIRLDEARHAAAEKAARVNQLEQDNVGTAEDVQKARNDLAKASQDQLQAEQGLNDARVTAMEQANKQIGKLSADLSSFGNELDADFGIFKGLGGIIENAVKALGNALAAPFLQALGMVEKANPNEGSGLTGILAANGTFGSQYTPGAIAAAQAAGQGPGYGAAGLQSSDPRVGQMIALAQSANGGQYDWGGSDLANGLADCSGAVADLVEIYKTGQATPARGPGGSGFSTESDFAALGFQPGYSPGNLNIGVKHGGQGGGHMTSQLPNGVNFESGGSHGGIAYGGPAASPLAPQFTEQWHLPVGGGGVGSPIGPTPGLASVPMLPGGPLANGAPQGLPGVPGGPAVSPASFQQPGVSPGNPYPSQGGNSGNLVGGLALDGALAATGIADLMMPGAGAAAKIGIQLMNRTIGYGAQNAGIAASGVMETLSLGDNPRGGIGGSWLGKLAGGLAGAAPALPNIAGKKPPGPMDQAGGDKGKAGDTYGDTNIQVTAPPGADGNTQGKHVAEHQVAARATPGTHG